MKREFRLADIGEGLDEAEIVAWRVKIGDRVDRDEALVEVMTDKSNADLPAPWAGTVTALGGAVGDMIKVGDIVAIIDDGAAGESPAAATAPLDAPPPAATGATFFTDTAAPRPGAPSPVPVSTPPVSTPPESTPPDSPTAIPLTPRRAKASPTTRREAARRGIDISQINGSGPGGRVLLSDLDVVTATGSYPQADTPSAPTFAIDAAAPTADVAAVAGAVDLGAPAASAAASSAPGPASPQTKPPAKPPNAAALDAAQTPAGVQPLRGVRRVIARNMTTSWSEIPHIHAWREIDAEPLIELRARLRDSGREHYSTLTPLAFFLSAVAHGLRTFPIANGSLDLQAETITTHPDVNIGIAVASPQGLVVPVIRNADQLSLSEIAQQISHLVGQARAGALGAESFQGGTATITNFGSLGGENATPILRPPESVIVGFGSIASRPFVIGDEVVARKTMNIVVGADHRLLDGDVTTALLNHVCERLIDPIDLALGL